MDKREVSFLWTRRFRAWSQDRIAEWRRIANGYLFLPVFLFMLGLYYYPLFLQWLPADIPLPPILAALFSLAVVSGRMMHYLEPADLIFLPAIESKMGSYFRRTYILSFIKHSLSLLILFTVLAPLFIKRISSNPAMILLFLLLLFLVKGWNLSLYGLEVRHSFFRPKVTFYIIRLLGSFLIIWGLIGRGWILLIAGLTLSLFLTLYLLRLFAAKEVAWASLLEEEERVKRTYFRRVGLFIDLPFSVDPIKKRQRFARFADKVLLPFRSPYVHFLLLQWIRSDGFLFFLRLFVVSFLLTLLFPSKWSALLLASLVVLLSHLQFDSFWRSLQRRVLIPIMPIDRLELERGEKTAGLSLLFFFILISFLPLFVIYPFDLLQWIGFASFLFLLFFLWRNRKEKKAGY